MIIQNHHLDNYYNVIYILTWMKFKNVLTAQRYNEHTLIFHVTYIRYDIAKDRPWLSASNILKVISDQKIT